MRSMRFWLGPSGIRMLRMAARMRRSSQPLGHARGSPGRAAETRILSCKFIEEFARWGGPPGRCELIEAVRAANGSRKKLRVCRPYKQSVGPRDTLHIPGICALFSESRLVHIFQGVCPTISVQFPALEKLSEFGNADEYI